MAALSIGAAKAWHNYYHTDFKMKYQTNCDVVAILKVFISRAGALTDSIYLVVAKGFRGFKQLLLRSI